MAITDPMVLPADVILVPVTELSEKVRKQFDSADGDYAITRPHSRTPSKIVDSYVAELLKEFRTARTIVEAVINYCQANQLRPEETLEEAFPCLQQLVKARILVSVDSEEASQIVACFKAGDRVDRFEILRCIQVLEDTELYYVTSADGQEAAFKIVRPGCGRDPERAIDREASILKILDGKVNPHLWATGTFEGRRYLATAWCPGIPATSAAEELRQQSLRERMEKLLELCRAILEAYAHLHTQKVIHSDVHPRNVLVDRDGTVKIVDFGLARVDGLSSEFCAPPRGGIGFFFEPEYAIARLNRRHPPRSTLLGEQYALAAMIYLLVTGVHYLDFSAEKQEMLRQIAEDRPVPFAARGDSWPEVEALLSRALSKSPSDRFDSIAELARYFSEIDVVEKQGPPTIIIQPTLPDQTAAEALLDEVLRRAGLDGPLVASGVTTAPTSSVNYGASGIAYALYRLACIRSDAALLSLADSWSTWSVHNIDNNRAFYNPEIDITPATVGQVALYHTASGVHAVQALISHAMGDVVSHQAALDAFVAASTAPCDNLDLTLGRSSTLIGCSILLEVPAQSEFVNRGPLLEFGDDVLKGVWAELNAIAPIREATQLPFLGIAHGWAGILYATLRWCQTASRPLPSALEDRLRQLAECAEPAGQGVRWKIKLRKHRHKHRDHYGSARNYMAGWCNGSAGYVFLWTLAHRIYRDEIYLMLAERAAWNAWEEGNAHDSLCCGLAGGAYALLNLYRQSGAHEWLRRAQELTSRAVASTVNSAFPNSLYKGTIGVSALVADLLKPEIACMPLFEDERWRA